MGTDIYSVIQGQWLTHNHQGEEITPELSDSSCWHTIGEGFHDRDYQLFNALAGARGGKAVIHLRGLPENFIVRDCYHPIPQGFCFDSDGFNSIKEPYDPWEFFMGEHSFSWFTVDDLGEIAQQRPETEEEIAKIRVRMGRFAIAYPHYKNWRLVIGFDS